MRDDPRHQSTDIVARLGEWTAADMDTHASLRRNGAQVAEVPWSRHGTDLHEVIADAAAEIGRLRAVIRVNGLRQGATDAEIDEVIHGQR